MKRDFLNMGDFGDFGVFIHCNVCFENALFI